MVVFVAAAVVVFVVAVYVGVYLDRASAGVVAKDLVGLVHVNLRSTE